jgi:hypothetical protein
MNNFIGDDIGDDITRFMSGGGEDNTSQLHDDKLPWWHGHIFTVGCLGVLIVSALVLVLLVKAAMYTLTKCYTGCRNKCRGRRGGYEEI